MFSSFRIFSVNNKLYFSSLIFHVFPNGRSVTSLECRARTGRFGRKYILRNYDPFRAEGDLSYIFPDEENDRRFHCIPFDFYMSFRCFVNLILALIHYEKSTIPDILSRHSQQGLSCLFLRLFFFFFHGRSASRYVCLGWPYAKLISRHG